MSIFPQDDKERQKAPVGQFVRDFFPHAIAALARHSWENQQKHTPGSTKLTWAKDKSIGTGDQLMRHFMDGEYVHTAWRALELLERQLTGMPPFACGQDKLPAKMIENIEQLERTEQRPTAKDTLPEGWAYLGEGIVCNPGGGISDDIAAWIEYPEGGEWDFEGFEGIDKQGTQYAVRRGTAIARANGIQ